MQDEFELQIYLARHGESLGNLAFAQGGGQDQQTQADKHDPELTPRGRTQAVLLGERLSRERFDAIFSSSLVRAVSTAHEVSIRQPGGAVPVEVLRDLAETGTPWSYIGYPLDALRRRYPEVESSRCLHDDITVWMNAEKEDERTAHMTRAEHCIRYFRGRFHSGEKIFVAAHGSFNTYLIRAALGLNNSNDFNFCQENTGLTKIKYFLDSKARLSYANDTSHLYAENPQLAFSL